MSDVRFSVSVTEWTTRVPISIRCKDLWTALLVMARYRARDPRLVAEVPQRRGEKA